MANLLQHQQRRRRSEPSEGMTSVVLPAVRKNVSAIREQAGEQVSALTGALRDRGQSLLAEQKSLASAELAHLGAAVRSAADRLHNQRSEMLAKYVDTAAHGLDGVARYVEEVDLNDLGREIGRVARQRPALVVGGAFLAGLAIARFIKAGQAVQGEPQQHGRRTARNPGRRGQNKSNPRRTRNA
jgi:hypothetical protein